VLGLVVVATLARAGSAAAQPRGEIIERVVAVVNDEAIFLSELRRRAVPFLSEVMKASSEEEGRRRLRELYEQILDRLVEQELFEQAAQRMQVRISSDDVNRAIQNLRRQSNLSEQQFWEAVRQQGMTEAQYRKDLRTQLLRMKVLNQRVRGRINLTEADVREKYEEKLRTANRKLRFRASHCFLPLPEDASATRVASVRTAAEEARRELTPERFDECIAEHTGGELGWLSQGDLPKILEQALMTLEPGQMSDPVRGSTGYHIFLLHERERGGADAPAFEDVKQQLMRQMLDQAMAKQEKQYLSELKREAVVDRRL
jgi:peptidyl-prolyl cis-trans isomerase SurA